MLKLPQKYYNIFNGFTAREIENAIYQKHLNSISSEKVAQLTDVAQEKAEKYIKRMKNIGAIEWLKDMKSMGGCVELVTIEKLDFENDLTIGEKVSEKIRVYINEKEFSIDYDGLNKKTAYDMINENFGDLRAENTLKTVEYLNKNA